MKYFLLFVTGLVLLASIIYAVPSLRAQVIQTLSYSECDTPLSYKLGNIDTKFGLSNSQVLDDIQQAGAIWTNAEGKNLFMYSPHALLTIQFIYDERAALNSQINSLQSQLTQSNASLKEQIANYQSQENAFEQKLAAFNAEVDTYNKEGGAPPDVYKQLTKEQQDLNAQGNALNQMAKQLNLSTNNYNDNVLVYNGDIHQFQNELAQKPEEGLYDGENNTITIYFADNKEELIHTLSHELGHALGMVHVQDPHAIMYPYTTTSEIVTADDKNQLTYVCREQSLIIHDGQLIDIWIFSKIQNLSVFLHQKLQQVML